MSINRVDQMGDQIIACPTCEKHINFSLVELTVDMEVKFVKETEIEPGEEYEVHEARCPAGHGFYYAAGDLNPLPIVSEESTSSTETPEVRTDGGLPTQYDTAEWGAPLVPEW